MKTGKDYLLQPFLLAVLVIAMLLAAGFIPPVSLGSVRLKRINIISDIYEGRFAEQEASQKEYSDTTFTAQSIEAASPENLELARATPAGTSQSWDIGPQGIVATPQDAAPVVAQSGQLPDILQVRDLIEEYGTPATGISDFGDPQVMPSFYAALERGYPKRPVRIAVLGDSFIEADIITADIREQLQDVFGGDGAGFVPFASPLAKYRATVNHTFSGWQTYNVMNRKSAPEAVREKFFVSGLVCIPSEGAWTRIEGTAFRKHLSRSSVARMVFTSEGNTTLHVTINDSISSMFTPEPSPLVQQINLRGDIRSIEVRISSSEGFTGYGIILEDEQGITVDNFSIRGNSGMALFATNSAVNTQIDKLLGYDLVILQYGLNSMSPDILNYAAYGLQMGRIINYVKQCFPSAAVMVMSVGDRSTQKAGEYVTMPAARAMLTEQEKAATRNSTAFWNTFQAMGGEKSMVKFVNNKWAAKDYTHIGYPGGKYIATEFVKSLLQGCREHSDGEFDPDTLLSPGISLPGEYAQPVLPARAVTVAAPTLITDTAGKDTTANGKSVTQQQEEPAIDTVTQSRRQ